MKKFIVAIFVVVAGLFFSCSYSGGSKAEIKRDKADFTVIEEPALRRTDEEETMSEDEMTITVCSQAVAPAHNLDWRLLKAIACVESEYTVSITGRTNDKGAWQISSIGLTDFNWKNGTDYSHEEMNTDPMLCCRVAAWSLSQNYKYLVYGGIKEPTLEQVLTAYNMGCGSVLRGMTNDYAERVYSVWNALKQDILVAAL